MDQLILDTAGYAVAMPESRKGGYTASLTPLSEDVEMISGRLVRELRGNVWTVNYQYGYFSDEMKRLVIAACEKGGREPIVCDFLKPDSGGVLSTSTFWVTKFKYPKFMWGRNDKDGPVPLWGDFSLALREVRPSD